MVRDSRGSRGRMVYFTLCLAVGVAAVVGTAALAAGIRSGFDEQSREILGADLTVDARRPLPDDLDAAVTAEPGVERSDTLETMSMVVVPGEAPRSRLAQVFAIRGRYPLYGTIATDPPGGLAAHLGPDTAVLEPDLLAALDVSVGDTLRVGNLDVRVAAVGEGGPQPGGFSSFLAARLYLTRATFERTGLLGFGSRVRHRALLALPGRPSHEAIDGFVERLEAAVPGAEYLDFDAHHEIRRGRRWVERTEGYVGLVALLSLVIGGIGVALIVRTWVASRTRPIAVMRCLGVRPSQILLLSLGHIVLLALGGCLFGAAAGCALPHLVRTAAPDLLPVEVVAVLPWGAVLRGVGLGLGLALAFALPPLTAIWRVSPARVLRADAVPLPPNAAVRVAAGALLLAGVLGAAWVQADEPLHAAWFTGGFALLVGLLFLVALGLIAAARVLPRRRLSPYLVHGVSALARPGAGTAGIVVALGLGAMVMTTVVLVESTLRDALRSQVPEQAPSVFLIDIQENQRAGVQALLEEAGASNVDTVPVVNARIAAIDGTPVSEIDADDTGRSRWSLTREQRLTWRQELTPDNRITAGALWSDPDRQEVSIEERYARRLGVDVGSTLTFDVQGVSVEVRVTSLRSVEWQSFSINFFLVLEPGTLDGAPATWLLSAQVPEDAESALQDRVAAAHPGVSVLRVGAVLEQVMELLGRISIGLRILGLLTVLAGLAILAGAIAATALRRGREVALLKTLGVTRGGIVLLFVTEYGLCGALAGLVGAGGALLLAWTWLVHVADVDVALPFVAVPLTMVAFAVLTSVCGVLASARALAVRPNAVLR
jgi:putative ABC transport system permease protein